MISLENSRVLITGVTGLIGGEFARTLAKKRWGYSYCLIRGRKGETAADRLAHRLRRGGAALSVFESKHLSALEGDLTLPELGIAPLALDLLRERIDLIIHCAAETSFIRSQNCQTINIEGTKRLIEFARSCKRPPLIVYLSTACNIGEAEKKCLREEEGCQPNNAHFNAYTRSKAVAETLVKESGLPVLIIRPSIVLGAGLNDAEFARQILWVAPLFNAFDCLPIDPSAKLDIVPVSFVVEATLKLLRTPHRRHDCYHVSAGNEYAIEMKDLTQCINRHYGKDVLLKGIPASEWNQEHTDRYVITREQRKLYSAFRYYMPFLNMNVVFDNSRLKEAFDGDSGLSELGLTHPVRYLPQLLDLVKFDDAVTESDNP
jgi:nucleoside-diphosphate-sugar epimerase